MPAANSPLGRLIKSLGAAPAPRHYPPTKLGRLCAALAMEPLPELAPPAATSRRGRAG
ncbi:hypothetical protein [Streptomyces sp. NPDC006645]|uniref:hypothetical protein n=1 Tax=unclassified Streptomyces TaxID=2593676 RepID=UPI0033BBA325